MKLTVCGATGRIGRQVVRQALESGNEVTAVVRDPARLPVRDLHGSGWPRSPTSPTRAVAAPPSTGRDAVISAGGPRRARSWRGTQASPAPALTRDPAALDRAGVRRFVAVSAAPVGPLAEGEAPSPHSDLPADPQGPARRLRGPGGDGGGDRAGGTAWTVVRPPGCRTSPEPTPTAGRRRQRPRRLTIARAEWRTRC